MSVDPGPLMSDPVLPIRATEGSVEVPPSAAALLARKPWCGTCPTNGRT